MAIIEHDQLPEVEIELQPDPNDPLEQIPDMNPDDALILGAIEVIQKEGWNSRGWGGQGEGYCILASLTVAKHGSLRRSVRSIPADVIDRVYRAFVPAYERPAAARLPKQNKANYIMRFNDHSSGARAAGGKRYVLQALRKALADKGKRR